MKTLTLLLTLLILGGNVWAESDVPVQTIVLEAGNQGYEGMLAVAEVIRNRAVLKGIPPDEVCMTPFQFSCWNSALKAKNKLSKVSAETWNTAQRAWQTANIDQTDTVNGADHYYAYKMLKYLPAWAGKMERVAKVKDHVFFREG